MKKLHQNPRFLKSALLAVIVFIYTACASRTSDFGANISSVPRANAQRLNQPKQNQSNRIYFDVKALVNMGPRVTGTPVMEKASGYLIDQFRQAGYTTEVQIFTYEKFRDQGSKLIVDGKVIEGNAFRGSMSGKLNAPLVVVPNIGSTDDFAKVSVKGAIAVVRRGEIRFSEKTRNAVAAGAVGVVIINTQPDELTGGSLVESSKIPVLGISGTEGNRLLQQIQKSSLRANLDVNSGEQKVTGRNIIARIKGVTQPKIIIGGHYDSVASSPGANDNASGTAVVLETARRLSKTPLAKQVWFVAFDGEEDGLHGSQAFVEKAGSGFLKDLKAMINFDMVGINDKLGIGGTPSLAASIKNFDPELQMLGSSASSDHASFADAGVPVLFFHRGLDPNYHTPRDTKVEPKLLEETLQVALVTLNNLFKLKNFIS